MIIKNTIVQRLDFLAARPAFPAGHQNASRRATFPVAERLSGGDKRGDPMAKRYDLSDFSEDELTELIDEATNLRTTKFEGRDRQKNIEQQERKLERELREDRARNDVDGL
jgi:hypothetical protein